MAGLAKLNVDIASLFIAVVVVVVGIAAPKFNPALVGVVCTFSVVFSDDNAFFSELVPNILFSALKVLVLEEVSLPVFMVESLGTDVGALVSAGFCIGPPNVTFSTLGKDFIKLLDKPLP